jgi:hypothetical protein
LFETLIGMAKRDELSTLSLLGVSLAFAVVGLAAYLLLVPISPNVRVAMGHAAIDDPIAR